MAVRPAAADFSADFSARPSATALRALLLTRRRCGLRLLTLRLDPAATFGSRPLLRLDLRRLLLTPLLGAAALGLGWFLLAAALLLRRLLILLELLPLLLLFRRIFGVPCRIELSVKSPQSKAKDGLRSGPARVGIQIEQQIVRGAMRPYLRTLIITGAAVLVGAAGLQLRAAEPSAVGLWEQVDENHGKPESWFKITERNGVYQGNIVKIFFKPGEDENFVCDKCEGDERGRPVLGLALIKGMQRNGNSYENGTIMDPRDGKVYRALMRLSEDGQKLEVRGYLGISLFGRSQTWNRLPDNALDPPKPARPGAKKK